MDVKFGPPCSLTIMICPAFCVRPSGNYHGISSRNKRTVWQKSSHMQRGLWYIFIVTQSLEPLTKMVRFMGHIVREMLPDKWSFGFRFLEVFPRISLYISKWYVQQIDSKKRLFPLFYLSSSSWQLPACPLAQPFTATVAFLFVITLFPFFFSARDNGFA